MGAGVEDRDARGLEAGRLGLGNTRQDGHDGERTTHNSLYDALPMRSLVILTALVLLLACKKPEQTPEPDPTPTTGARGHSVTKIKDTEHEGASGDDHAEKPVESSGSDQATGAGEGSTTGAEEDPKKKPAYRDDQGRVHGPGGPVFGGRRGDCTPDKDHCLRDGVLFASGPYRTGALFRATPVFEFEGKTWTWMGDEYPPNEYDWLFKTKVATKSDIVVGEPIVWVIKGLGDNTDFLASENEALTSSRWDVGVVESINSDFIRVSGWAGNVKIDTVRIITEKKKTN